MKKVIFWLFAALFFFVPLILWPYTSEVFEFNKMVFVYLLTTIILAVWLIRSVLERKWIFRRTILDVPLLIFLGSQLISTVLSIDPRTSWLGYYSRFNGGFLSTVCYSFLYWAFVSNFEPKHVLKLINTALLPSALLVSIYAVAEHFGIDKNLWVQDVQTRVFSTIGQPNWLAAWLVAIIPITWVFTLRSESKSRNSYIYTVLSVLFFWTLIFTKSRSGLLAFTVAFVIFWAFYFWNKRGEIKKSISPFIVVCSSLLVVVLISGTPWTPSLTTFFGQKTATSNQKPITGPALEVGGTESGTIRKIVWRGALDIWKNYPVFGTGAETFAYSYYQFRPKEHNLVSEWDFIYNKAHNEFLNIAANTGTVGLVSYLVLIGFSIYVFVKKLRFTSKPNNSNDESLLTIALLSGYVSLLITNFFGFSVVATQIQLFLYPAMGIVLSTEYFVHSSEKQKLSSFQKLIIFFLLSAVVYVLLAVGRYWYADTLYANGKSYNSIQGYSTAANYLSRASALAPNEGLYHNELSSSLANIALALDNQKETQKAKDYIDLSISESDKAASLSPVNLNFMRTRFGIFIMLTSIDPNYMTGALSTLEKAIKYAPTDAKILYNLGLIYVRIGEKDRALKALQKTIELKANYKDPRIAYAILLDQKGETREARAQLEYILTNIDPNDSLTKQTLDEIK